MSFKRICVLLLAFLMCAGVLASCTENENESNTSESVQNESVPEEESKEPMPEYWGFNDYNTVDIKGAPEEIKSYETTVTKVSDKKYAVSCTTEAGKLTITLEERPWGCFNLWAWNLVDKNGKTHTFAVGATDFEYVHVPTTPKGTNVWSGGNHGNEAFLSLDFYNAETGEKLELETGKAVTVNSLHVIEKTKLLWFPDDNGDSIGDYNNKSMSYTDDDVYCEMTRKYTFTGPQIKLNCDYKYVKDVIHGRSYTCMMPINKKYGLWCEMYDNDGKLLKTIETLKVGAADYSGPSNSGNAASRAVVYGYADPRYQFDVRVTTYEDSLDKCNGDYKTAFWDMNTTDNKLYFTKFSNSAKKTLTAGTEFHTECIWLFKYVEDAATPDIKEPETSTPDEAEPIGKLVSGGKEYTLSGLLGTGYGNYTAKLTDGKYTTTLTYDNNWFSFFNSSALKPEELNTENGIAWLILDLEKETDISFLRAHICNGGTAGINAPKNAKVSVSNDGTNFTDIGELPISTDPSAIYWSHLETENVTARYVKFTFTPNGLFVFLNEVEVYEAQ
ncbi:MAG: discoidin domain-containing protein [Clostridia bacterium]|nr:discoidin domain-containing protein [Clostridia bacterium]